MKRFVQVLVGLAVAGGVGASAWYLLPSRESDPLAKSPIEAVRQGLEKMECPQPFILTGNEDGELCHEIIRIKKDGSREMWLQHIIPGRDFRVGDAAEHCEWIKADAIHDAEEVVSACAGAPHPFLGTPAFADPPYCVDCGGGGGCAVKTCPATAHTLGPCSVGGTTCAMTFVCCDWPCVGWPPC